MDERVTNGHERDKCKLRIVTTYQKRKKLVRFEDVNSKLGPTNLSNKGLEVIWSSTLM